MHAYENMSTLPSLSVTKNSLYVMLNEVKHLYHEDPSLALRMTGRIVSGWQVTNIVTRWRYAKFSEAIVFFHHNVVNFEQFKLSIIFLST